MPANANASPALDDGLHGSASQARAKLEDALGEFKERATQVAQETLDNLRQHAKPYVGDAGEHIATAERYIVDRVQKQPITTTLAVLGVGVLVGLVLAGGRSR